MLAQFGLAKGIGGAAGKTETSEDHWKTIDSLKPWAGWSSVSLRQRSGSPARYSTGSGAHDGSVWPRDTHLEMQSLGASTGWTSSGR